MKIRMRKLNKSGTGKGRLYRPFPYHKIAKMWAAGMTIAAIARSIKRVDHNNGKDPYHTMRNCLYRMHRGYTNDKGKRVKLPHRVSNSTLRKARKAGLSAA